MNKKLSVILLLIVIFLLNGCQLGSTDKEASMEAEEAQIETDDVADTEEVSDEETSQVETEDIEKTLNEERSNFNPNMPTFNENGVWYEIFVRAFADSNGDGVGDLKGITDKLDYLNDNNSETSSDLGVNGLWLMPISPSPSYHGYDVTNYYEINPDYGTMEDFEELLDEAHQRGIKIIIDLVLNHSSSEHPWFKEAIKNPESPYRDYYRIVNKNTDGYNFQKTVWNHPVWNQIGSDYYYAIFWDQMPDLNYDEEELRSEMINVATFWLEKGVDGFRIDAVSHVFGSGELQKGVAYEPKINEWWLEFNEALRTVNPNYYLVGEAWEPIESRVDYNGFFDTTFNFDVAESKLLAMAKNEIDYKGDNNGLITELTRIYDQINTADVPFIDAPFLTNHDQRRAMDYLNGDITDMKLASTIYMTLPGNPFIYYGEEIGMTGNKPDENIREPFIWGSSDAYQTSWKALDYNGETMSVLKQQRIPDSLLNHYKQIIKLRQSNIALLSGSFEGIETSSPRVVAYNRSHNEQSVVVIHNLALQPNSITFNELGISSEGHAIVYSSSDLSAIDDDVITVDMKSTIIITFVTE